MESFWSRAKELPRNSSCKAGLEALEPQKVIGAFSTAQSASAYSGYYYRTSAQS